MIGGWWRCAASCAALEARFENTNARMLKKQSSNGGDIAPIPARKSTICRSKDYVTVRRSLGRTDLAEADLARKKYREHKPRI